MKVKNVKVKGAKNVEGMMKRNIIESCIRSIAEADAIAAVDGYDENYVLELIARTLLNYAKRSREDE